MSQAFDNIKDKGVTTFDSFRSFAEKFNGIIDEVRHTNEFMQNGYDRGGIEIDSKGNLRITDRDVYIDGSLNHSSFNITQLLRQDIDLTDLTDNGILVYDEDSDEWEIQEKPALVQKIGNDDTMIQRGFPLSIDLDGDFDAYTGQARIRINSEHTDDLNVKLFLYYNVVAADGDPIVTLSYRRADDTTKTYTVIHQQRGTVDNPGSADFGFIGGQMMMEEITVAKTDDDADQRNELRIDRNTGAFLNYDDNFKMKLILVSPKPISVHKPGEVKP